MKTHLQGLIALAVLSLAANVQGQCVDWTPGYHLAGIGGVVSASALFDDGSGNGPELYLGGTFDAAGDVAARNIVKWNGTRWAPVGAGRPTSVTALFVWSDGSGPVLLAGCAGNGPSSVGDPQGSLARWDGQAWTGFAGTAQASHVESFATFDDGSGPALYVGGYFNNIAGQFAVQGLARFDGANWSTVGAGLFTVNAPVRALIVHDDGSGPKLFAGGNFISNVLFGPTDPLWRWDGSTWTDASSGWNTSGVALAFALRHSSTGAVSLYAGGRATVTPVQQKLMRWNGSGWDAVGPFLAGGIETLLETWHPVTDSALLAGGDSTLFNGLGSGGFGTWDGAQWNVTPALAETVLTLAIYDEGSGPRLFAGLSDSPSLNGMPPRGIARLEQTGWTTPGTSGAGVLGSIEDFAVVHGANAPTLYACGYLDGGNGAQAQRVVRFTGSSWGAVGTPFNHSLYAVEAFDDGVHGDELYACGYFTNNNGVGMNRIARWDGTFWQQLGAGIGGIGYEAQAKEMLTYDDGTGERLVVLGDFNLAGGAVSPYVAAWDGTQWSTFGTGLDGPTTCGTVYDDGSGPALYVGGSFSHAGGVPAQSVARWNGTAWSAVGAGPGIVPNHLAVLDSGNGPKLYASAINGFEPLRRWNGASWELVNATPFGIAAMTVYDDGSGAGARLFAAAQAQPSNMATFNGTTWTVFGGGIAGTAHALAVFDDGAGPALFAGGSFRRTGAFGSVNVGRYGPTGACTPVTGTPYCFGDGTGASCPCGNVGAPQHGCSNSMNAGGALLVAEGQAHLSSDTVTLRASGMPPNASLLFFQGTGQVASGLGASFGDGLRCVNGSVVRMAIRHATAGSSAFGHGVAGDPSVSAAGHLPSTWSTREYQAWYRDAQSFCTSSTFNLTNGVSIRWAP